jgi:exodeoxyribonuclease VII small subunit
MPMSAKKTTSSETPDFERAMSELEETVRRLEAGDLPLEESLSAFEKGVALVRTLHARLDSVQMRIEELTKGPDGAPSLVPLAAASSSEQSQSDDDEDADG